MIIKKIKLSNYRNYEHLEVDFNSHLNIIIGDNAQGKTNILESIYVLALTKSFQKINDKNLIRFNSLCAKINGSIIINDNTKNLQLTINEKSKKVKINNNEVKKFYNYISKLNVVLFTPDDIKIFRDSPSARRRIINMELSQINNKYIRLINSFNIILKQRNEYLKNSNINYDYLSIINEKFVELSTEIYLIRYSYIKLINCYISKIYSDITLNNDLSIKYVSNVEYDDDVSKMKEKLINKINKNFEKEKIYGISLYGPHRDDFSFYLGDIDLALYGSQGQLRTAMLSFKLSELELIKEKTNEYPILLLDDVFSELDNNKKNNIIKYIKDDIQTIITTTDIDMINREIVKQAKIITIKNGYIIKQEGKV